MFRWMKLSPLALFLAPITLLAQPSSKDMVTLTLTATCTASAKRADPDLPMKDSLTLTLNEQASYRILGQGVNGLELAQLHLRNNRSASGGGTQGLPSSPMLKPVSWTYTQTRPTSSTPFGGVYIDSRHGRGRIEVYGLSDGVKASDDSWGAPALAAAGMDFSPPGPEFKKNLEFTFDPKASTFSRGGRATHTYTFTSPDGKSSWMATLQVSYTVSRGEVPEQAEVTVEIPGYDTWVPEATTDDESRPGNELQVRAWVHKAGDPKTPVDKPAEFTFELYRFGQEKGLCMNWPTNPGESSRRPDLRILTSRNPGLAEGIPELVMRSKGYVKEAKAVLSSFDYAAWGLLKITAKDREGNELAVNFRQRKDAMISIPRDEDRNHIADAWQEARGVMGLSAEWDDTDIPGQLIRGDGVPLFAEYRGFVVHTTGGHTHTRLNPKEKVHFVIDPHNVFDTNRWWEASKIRAYKVLQSWTKNRVVDIHRGFGGMETEGKWATLIEEDTSVVNENQPEKALKKLRSQWAVSEGAGPVWIGTPKNVEVSRIFTGRIRYTLKWIQAKMLRSLKAPASADDREEAEWLLTLGIPKDKLVARLETMTPADLESLVKPLVAWMAIHENAHACGVNGHLNAKGEEDEKPSGARVPDCPMQYMDWKEKRRLVLFGERGGAGKFCSDKAHRCWQSLTTKW